MIESWSQIQPAFRDLLDRPLDKQNVSRWLAGWTESHNQVAETYARLKVALDTDTSNSESEARYHAFLDRVYQAAQAAEQQLKEKLLASRLEPERFEIPLRKMREEAQIFREDNLPLLAEERKLASHYDKIIGAQTVRWEGEDRTLPQMRPLYYSPEREIRQQAWQLAADRQLADRSALNTLWGQLLDLRGSLACNAGLPDYRAYRWAQMARLDYTAQDCFQFHQAIEQVAVPAATRVYEKHRKALGVESLRPWDLDQDLYPISLPALPAYGSVSDLERFAGAIFNRVDPQFGEYFQILQSENLLDLENRKGKAPGAYCVTFPVAMRPFIFMNAVGLSGDVRTILHESGHAFHSFERTANQPYAQQQPSGLEFAEVASMAMELLASPYLAQDQGGLYPDADAARFRIAHLERILVFWPYMAVVDAFQHWVYENPAAAARPENCDAKWLELWRRYLPGVDWSGLEAEAMTGWHRKQHIYRYPFYYVEYGVAQLGAVQIWRNARQDQAGAVRDYREALALGGTATLPDLFSAAGAKFAFDADTLGQAVALIEASIQDLEAWEKGK